jgi:mono/diheme cytochrome c family protein
MLQPRKSPEWARHAFSLVLTCAFAACSRGTQETDTSAGAPVDSGPDQTVRSDTVTRADTSAGSLPRPDVATPPITPPAEAAQDTPPTQAPPPAGQDGQAGPKVSQAEYEGWRQYSVNCARCHGQDVLPNPVAANLLISLGSGGPIDTEQKFFQVVSEGRPERGMPAFKGIMSAEQIGAVYAYVDGRAEKRVPPGRPARPPA